MPPRHIYVHVPFCARRCSYCDFAIAVRRAVPVDEYLDALSREWSLQSSDGGPWTADTVYFGGGTPSLLGADGVARLLDLAREHVTLAPDAEVTLEANPDDVTPEAARVWHANGINRLSIGSQSFDDRVLRWMHRTHDAAQIPRAVEAALAAGIDNLSLDLIFAVPTELGRDWQEDLDRATSLAPAHVSLYGLTVEPGTPLARWRDRGTATEAPEETYERDFLLAHDILVAAGYDHYEVSNYARAGLRSRHNSAYWQRVPYAGLGPSAHSFDGVQRRWNVAAYEKWRRRLRDGGDPAAGSEVLTDGEAAAERIYLALRTTEGLRMDAPCGLRVADCGLKHPISEPIARWEGQGWVVVADGVARLTVTGWLRLDAIAAALTLTESPY
ncbi:MAG: radical SAM family heme chaperone HemW [Gemmatimonadota bacterium]|nr:radical SAM family heme chaperone HemW [Gemmatimonadota bacterium]